MAEWFEAVLSILLVVTAYKLRALIINAFFASVGWVYLFIKYRSNEKVQEFIENEYKGYYSIAGRVYLLNFIAFIGALGLTIILIALIITTLWRLFNGQIK